MIMKRHGRGGRRRAGPVLVEAALVLPLVFLFILGIMEYGRFLMTSTCSTTPSARGPSTRPSTVRPIVVDNSSGTAVTYGNATTDVTNVVTGDSFGEQLGSQTISVFCPTTWETTWALGPADNRGSTCACRSPAPTSS